MTLNVYILVDSEAAARAKVLLGAKEHISGRIAKGAWKVLELMIPHAILVVEGVPSANLPTAIEKSSDSLPHGPTGSRDGSAT